MSRPTWPRLRRVGRKNSGIYIYRLPAGTLRESDGEAGADSTVSILLAHVIMAVPSSKQESGEDSAGVQDLVDSTEQASPDHRNRSLQQSTVDFPTVSVLSERTQSQSEPLSPGRNRKRTSDEAYRRSQPPSWVAGGFSTTPLKSPPRNLPFGNQKPLSQKPGNPFAVREASSNLRTAMMADSSQLDPSTLVPPPERETAPAQPVSFVDEVAAFQASLDGQFETYSRELGQRDRSTDLDKLDWDELEQRYTTELRPLIDAEETLHTDISQRMQVSRTSGKAETQY